MIGARPLATRCCPAICSPIERAKSGHWPFDLPSSQASSEPTGQAREAFSRHWIQCTPPTTPSRLDSIGRALLDFQATGRFAFGFANDWSPGLAPDPVIIERVNGLARKIRRSVLERSRAANVGHIGSSLSVVEIMATLWGGLMREAGTKRPDRDRFVLCKGHAALALYAAMHHGGIMSAETLATYCADGTHLGVHPEACLEGIDVATGSLGQ
ncbi:MAG: hypothetical protein ACKON9_28500, partial [Planctomycetaceae bacterium]